MSISMRQFHVIPTLWTYLIKSWLGIFVTSLLGIIALLLSTKLEEVARFISLGASSEKIIFFILLQIPYVLQIAVPVAGCLSGFLLFARLSTNGELVAARSVGYSLKRLVQPIVGISCIGSLLMFGWMFDLAARSHLQAQKLEHDVRAEEPLALVQNSQYMNKTSYLIELEGSLRTGGDAKNLIACFHPSPEGRLELFLAKEVHNRKGVLEANDFLVITTEKPKTAQSPCAILIEQAHKKLTPTLHINEFIEKKHWKVNPDHCPLSVVFARGADLKQLATVNSYKGEKGKNTIKDLGKYSTEPFRRISLSLALASLTMTGAFAGIHIGRRKKKGRFLLPMFLFGFYMACYLAGKNLDCLPLPAITCYLFPHPILVGAALHMKKYAELGLT